MSKDVVQKIVLLVVIFLGFAGALFFLAVPIDCSPVIQMPANPVPPNPNDKPIDMNAPRPAKRPASKDTQPAKDSAPGKTTAPSAPAKDSPAKDAPAEKK